MVDTLLESGGVPRDELDSGLGLDSGHGRVHVLDDNISTVKEADGHVAVIRSAGIGLDHEVGGLESSGGDLSGGVLLLAGLSGRQDWGKGLHHEVDAGVGHQVDLELVEVNVQVTLEAEGGSQGGDDLGDQAVEVGVGWGSNIKVALADVVDGLIVIHEVDIGVLQQSVGGQDGVVGLNDGGGHHGGGVDGEGQLGLLWVVLGKALQKEAGMSGTGTSTNSVVHEAERN